MEDYIDEDEDETFLEALFAKTADPRTKTFYFLRIEITEVDLIETITSFNCRPNPNQRCSLITFVYRYGEESQAEIEIEKMKLEIAQLELAGDVEESKMRFMSESHRTETDKDIAHADNLVRILTSKVH